MEKGERQLYLNYLTESQKEVLERYNKEEKNYILQKKIYVQNNKSKKIEKNSVLQNQIFRQSDEWELIDIKVNANYHDTDQREADKQYRFFFMRKWIGRCEIGRASCRERG